VAYLDDEVAALRVDGAEVSVVGFGLHAVDPGGGFSIEDGRFFQDAAPFAGSYLNLRGAQAPRDYSLSGELRFGSDRSGIGLTFHNQMPSGRDAFYRLRRTSAKKEMHLSPHGTVFSEGRTAESEVTGPGVWYAFRIEVAPAAGATRVRARIWPAGDEEPAAWRIDCLDATETRLEGGTVGLWGAGPGRKEFRRLVLSAGGRTVRLGEEAGEMARWEAPRAPDFVLALAERIPEGSFPIVLSHSPDIFPLAVEMGWPLVLAGHTQGGQIQLPFIGAITTDTALGRAYASGLFAEGRSQLYITRGVGTTRLPFRFLAPPEVALITLRGAGHGAPEDP
jgi:hypothetical protein